MKLDILAIAPHPDDIELGCGGTIAKAIAQGKKVGILDLTRGDLGTRGTPTIREQESKEAAAVLGVQVRENLGLRDGFFEINEANKLAIIKVIRKYQPNIIIASALEDRHPDHGRAAKLIKDAAFLSGLKRIETNQEAWRPNRMFHIIQWRSLQPDFVVDISGYLDKKVAACMAYKSQFYNPASDEPETAISSKNFKDSITYRASEYGRLIWKDAGEAFMTESLLGVDNLEVFL